MDRITDHHLRVIRVGIIIFASVLIVAFGAAIGHGLHGLMGNGTIPIRILNETTPPSELQTDLTKPKHHSKEFPSFIVTCLIFAELINVGLLVGTVKNCRCLLKIWLAKGLVMCFLGVFGIVLEFFGTAPVHGDLGAACIVGVLLYVVFMVLVWIFHEKGHELITHVPLDDRLTSSLINTEPLF